MAYIRNRNEERTGFQISAELTDRVDIQSDFVMVYGLNDTTEQRIKKFRDAGYVIQLMTGIAWGHYVDYLDGEWDGNKHWDESQTDRFGNEILHGPRCPYIVPTIAFADYITEKLKKAVDAGAIAIHVEEPEFWDRAGYSPAFKREYELYYRQPWQPPHESVDARFKAAKLKAYLYTRTIDRVSSALKEYAKTKYNFNLRFYVPTHSLLNYTQWKIVSPEGKLADIAGVDGCIAQVWTGTSRTKNWFNGEYKERTFDTAYLEYGVMQELVKGTGRHMWFLHDPIEDNPIFDWDDYRRNYFCTVAASLLHPKVNTYEICPWPNRVFYDRYPKEPKDASLPIPDEYATILNNTFNTLGTFEEGESTGLRVGILMADSQLYQREYPDSEYSTAAKEEVGTVLADDEECLSRFASELCKGKDDRELRLRYNSSAAFPGFYGMALPLLKAGIPVRPVLLDNVRRYNGYLDDYDVIIMSYEIMKPDYPDVNNSIATWVRQGGTLLYVGDGSDPYHGIKSWWSGKYANASEHLFEALGIMPENKQIMKIGKGTAAFLDKDPAIYTYSPENAEKFREFFVKLCEEAGHKVDSRNYLMLKRNEYIIAAVMDESVSDAPLTLKGLFADMFSPDFKIIKEKILQPGENCLLFDLDCVKDESLRIIGTSVRINSMEEQSGKVIINASGAGQLNAFLRVKLPLKPEKAIVNGQPAKMCFDDESGTALISFASEGKPVEIIIE